jgi:hypothetical protein
MITGQKEMIAPAAEMLLLVNLSSMRRDNNKIFYRTQAWREEKEVHEDHIGDGFKTQ